MSATATIVDQNPTPVLDPARELVDALANPPFLYEQPLETGRKTFETLVTAEIPTDTTTVETISARATAGQFTTARDTTASQRRQPRFTRTPRSAASSAST